MRISRNLSSADARTGENIEFEVLDEVKVNDVIVIPRGSPAMATVTEARSKKNMGRGGHLDVNIDYVRSPSGEKIPLRGIQNAKAGGHVGAMTGAMVATSIVFFPAAPLFLFVKGKDITIPKGHEITAFINGDVRIEPAKVAATAVTATTASAPKLSGKVLSNDDVLNLKNGGFSDELILAKVKSSPGSYKIDTDDLLALKKAGLSDAVISAMVSAPQN
ncbi:MAG: hypothetical protein JWN34_5787 [Bryobacterales bacterium]|nr:hypothetical protein [Bryobacterales bacterium]